MWQPFHSLRDFWVPAVRQPDGSWAHEGKGFRTEAECQKECDIRNAVRERLTELRC